MTTNEYTLQGWIDAFREQRNTITDFLFKTCKSDGERTTVLMDRTVLSKYHAELRQYIQINTFTEVDQHYYAYNPRLFSMDLYGVPELWYLVLYANEMHSAIQFNVPIVRFYSPSVVQALTMIHALELKRLDENAQEISDIVTNKTPFNNDMAVSITVKNESIPS